MEKTPGLTDWFLGKMNVALPISGEAFGRLVFLSTENPNRPHVISGFVDFKEFHERSPLVFSALAGEIRTGTGWLVVKRVKKLGKRDVTFSVRRSLSNLFPPSDVQPEFR